MTRQALLAGFVCLAGPLPPAGADDLLTTPNRVVEWEVTSSRDRVDPFAEVRLDARLRSDDGREVLLPGFWAGGRSWRFRFSAPGPGEWRYETVASDPADAGLHARRGTVRVRPAPAGEGNPLLRHGALRLSDDRRHFAHADGTPFFWLADSWWFGATSRLRFPDEFRLLAEDRVAKAFSVVQLAAAFPCDIAPFDPRGANETGHAWTAGFGAIRPAYFDALDRRIEALVDAGLVPNVVGAWGYYLPFMGVEKAKRHWRYLVARYGAYPVVWTLAGESTLVYYLPDPSRAERDVQVAGWTEVARSVRETDPFRRLLTVHPGPGSGGLRPLADMSLVDFVFLQPGHSDWETLPVALEHQARARRDLPGRPALIGEACFEGMHGGGCGPKIQRYLFWASVLSGAPGFSYGTDATWQMNRRGEPFGPSPHGVTWGNEPWEEAYRWPGSTHVGLGRRILSGLEWWRLEPHPEWVSAAATPGDPMKPFCAGIPGRLRVVYLPKGQAPWVEPFRLLGLEPGKRYRARWVDPITGRDEPGVDVEPTGGEWPLPPPPVLQDWVLVVEAAQESE